MVKTILDIEGLGGLNLLTLGLGSSHGSEASLLLNLGLRLILAQQAKGLSGYKEGLVHCHTHPSHTSILVKSAGELVDGWGNLQALLEDGALTLEADIERPLGVTGEVTLGLDVVANGKVTGALLEERVSDLLGGSLGLGGKRSSSDLLRSLNHTGISMDAMMDQGKYHLAEKNLTLVDEQGTKLLENQFWLFSYLQWLIGLIQQGTIFRVAFH